MKKYAYTELPVAVGEHLAVNAGILLNDFNPLNPAETEEIKQHIMFATSGGINASCVPTYSDWAEDVDNAPKNTKEFKHLDGWESKFSGTGITYTPENIKSTLGAADVEAITDGVASGATVKKITPRTYVEQTDFKDLWYVTDWNNGNGFIAIRLIDALSDGGFTHQSTDNGKGNVSFSYTGHKTAEDLDRPPMEFYVVENAAEDEGVKFTVTQELSEHLTSNFVGTEIGEGETLEIEIVADSGYIVDRNTIRILVNDAEVTGQEGVTALVAQDNKSVAITVENVTGNVKIIVDEEVEGV